MIGCADGGGDGGLSRREVVSELMNLASFGLFFQSFKHNKVAGGDASWRNAVAPHAWTPVEQV